MCRRHAPIHRKVGDQRVKIPAGKDVVVFELLVQRIAAERIVGFHQQGEIRIVGHFFARVLQAANAGHIAQRFAVGCINPLALGQRGVNMPELQHAKGGIDFAHLAVDARGHHGGFIHKTEVLQLVNAQLGFGVGADDGAAFKGVEDLGGVKAQHREVAMVEHTAAVTLHAKGMGGVVNNLEVVVVGNLLNGINIARVTIAMHRHDGRGLRGDGGFDLGWVEVQRVRVHVHKDGLDTVPKQ